MKGVLITRPEPGASQTAARVAACGFLPILAPVLTIALQTIRPPDRWAATILTSRNAVPACPPVMHSRPVFAVGSTTATAATSAGFMRVLNADGDAAALADLIANTLSPRDGTLVLPVAQGQGWDLTADLRQRGFRILRRIAYRAASVDSLPEAALSGLMNRQVGIVMLFSGETSRHFVRLLRMANMVEAVRNVEAVSISERAAVALRPLPWRCIRVASKPNQDAMLALLR